MHRQLRNAVLPGFLAICLAGCSRWAPQSGSPQSVLAEQTPSIIRVTLKDGRKIEIAAPMVRNDSIVGLIPGSSHAGTPLATFSAPLESVRFMAVKEHDLARSLSVVAGPPALIIGSIFLMGF